MARYLSCAVLLVISLASPMVSAEDFTLHDVVRLALARNERARLAGLGVTTADAAVAKARAAFLPSVTLTGSETLRPEAVQQNGRTQLRSNAAQASISVNQPLLAVAAYPLYDAARYTREAARHNQTDLRRLLCFDAVRAFFGVLTQQRLLAAAERRLERAESSLADTRGRVQAQLSSSNDETRSMVERAAALQTVATARTSLEQARVNLEYLLDAPIPQSVNPPAERLVPPDFNPAQLTQQALGQRPDLSASKQTAASARASAREPGMRIIPTLSATAQGRVADQAIAADRYVDTTVQLTLNWQIWDAGQRSADEQSRSAAAESAELQVRSLQRKVQAEVRAALVAIANAREAVQAAESGVEAARRSADETNVLYRQGIAKAIELLNANQSRFDAEVSLAGAQLALRQAELDLRAALGLFPIDGVQ